MASDDKPESFSYPLWCEDVAVDRLDADRERSAFIYSSLSDGVDRFVFQVLGRLFAIQSLANEYIESAAHTYQTIWYYANAYREIWTPDEAKTAVSELRDCFIAIDEIHHVVALAGGKPLYAYDVWEKLKSVRDVGRAYHISEVGRISATRGSRISSFFFELTMLKAIWAGYQEFTLNTAEVGDLFDKEIPNEARKMYEGHGFYLLRDGSGEVIGRLYKQRRADNHLVSDWRPYYYTTSKDFLKAMELRSLG